MTDILIQLVPLMVLSLLFSLIPFAIILKRLGRSRWWSAIALLPFGLLLLPWIVAFLPWKANPSPEQTAEVFR